MWGFIFNLNNYNNNSGHSGHILNFLIFHFKSATYCFSISILPLFISYNGNVDLILICVVLFWSVVLKTFNIDLLLVKIEGCLVVVGIVLRMESPYRNPWLHLVSCSSFISLSCGNLHLVQFRSFPLAMRCWMTWFLISAVKRSISSTTGFHNHGEGPY